MTFIISIYISQSQLNYLIYYKNDEFRFFLSLYSLSLFTSNYFNYYLNWNNREKKREKTTAFVFSMYICVHHRRYCIHISVVEREYLKKRDELRVETLYILSMYIYIIKNWNKYDDKKDRMSISITYIY